MLVLLALVQSAGSAPPAQPPAPPAAPAQPPTPAPPAAPAGVDVDPARLVFPVDAPGVVLVAVKADRTADYEALILALHEALAAADPPARRIGEGWRVYKAADPDAKGNALYVHVVATPLADTDYRPSVVLGRLAKRTARRPAGEVPRRLRRRGDPAVARRCCPTSRSRRCR